MPSAMTMQPSLAACTVTPWIRSSRRIADLSLANIVDVPDGAPPLRQAFSLTTNVSSSLRRPDLMALKTTSMVISLAIEAGGIGLSASFENSTVPVSASIMKACVALVSKSCAWAGASESRRPRRKNPAKGWSKRNCMKIDPLAGPSGKPAKLSGFFQDGSTVTDQLFSGKPALDSVAHNQRIGRAMRPCGLQQLVQAAVAVRIEIDRIPVIAIEIGTLDLCSAKGLKCRGHTFGLGGIIERACGDIVGAGRQCLRVRFFPRLQNVGGRHAA